MPYEAYERFHPVMAEDSGQSIVSSLFDHILLLAKGITEKLEKGIGVLDTGCGMGLGTMWGKEKALEILGNEVVASCL